MIYFSELQGKKVSTEDNVEVGKLEDMIFLATEEPLVTKLVIRGKLKDKLIIPIQYLNRINNRIIIKKSYITSTLDENELHIVKNLLDKQIIDLKGNKIVRVNDVVIQNDGKLSVIGVDIGLLAIFRWFKLDNIIIKIHGFFKIKPVPKFLSWADIQPLELVHGEVKLRKKEEKLQKIRPEDLADYLEKTNVKNARRFLRLLDEKRAAEVIAKLNLNYQSSLFRHYSLEKVTKLLNFIEIDDVVDVLLTLSQKRRQEILENLPAEKIHQINHLIKYSTSQIGDLLTTEFITVYPDSIVRDVIEKIKNEAGDFTILNNIYVINKQNQLVGVFNLHELILQDKETPVYKFMLQDVIVLHITTPVEIALNRMIKYKLQTLPVIDKNKSILGIVSSLKIIEIITYKTK